jgi:predicted O-methyltransferase YrrM
VLDTFCANVGPLLNTIVFPVVGRSLDWARRWPLGTVDLVFLDADHDYAAVAADIAAWRPVVRPGGILCGHDFGDFAGVTRAVVEAFDGRYHVEGTVWWVNV